MAVTDNDDVLVASTAWGATTASSAANSRCLTSSFSTMASTTSAQGARPVTVLASDTRARYAACISGVSLFLTTSFCQAWQKLVVKNKLTPEMQAAYLARVSLASTVTGLAPCALVVEAIVEKLDVKQRL